MSTLFRRPALRLLPRVTGTRRRRPTKVRRRQATSPPEVPPAVRRQLAVRFGFRTRRMSEQAIGATSRLRGAIGAITSFRQVTTAVPGRGQIVVSPCRKPLAPSPHRRDGRPGWRSPSDDRRGQPPGQRRWSQDSTDQQPPVIVNAPPPRRRRCHVCGQLGCYTVFHGPDAVSPQVPPAARCFVWNQRGCYPFRHRPGDQPPAPSAPNRPASPATGPARNAANPKSNWQRGWNQGERAPPANVPPRPQLH